LSIEVERSGCSESDGSARVPSHQAMSSFSRGCLQIAIALENALAYQEISDLKDRLAEEKLYLEEEIRSESATHARSAIGGRSLCGSISHKASPKRN